MGVWALLMMQMRVCCQKLACLWAGPAFLWAGPAFSHPPPFIREEQGQAFCETSQCPLTQC